MLRNVGRVRKALLLRGGIPRCDLRPVAANGALERAPVPPVQTAPVRLCHSETRKDYSLPNPSWSQAMMDQFNRLTAMTQDGTWQRLPSYRNSLEHAPEELIQKYRLQKHKGSRLFLRNLDVEGKGFEYAMFLNQREKRLAGVFQFGPYLEGPPGCAHGGSIATVLDTILGVLAMSVALRVMTANLSIDYKSPILLGSAIMATSELDRMDGRKVFVRGALQSIDGKALYAAATGLFIQLQEPPGDDGSPPPPPPPPL